MTKITKEGEITFLFSKEEHCMWRIKNSALKFVGDFWLTYNLGIYILKKVTVRFFLIFILK